ncbi:hypothetical protein [Paenibacillus sp. GCM10012303]|uniref:hypothetical protein n=1 Tax=Paenibacillus sp. GCM10012303 TaxID=3317340 RepID=UPI00361C237A
MNGRGKRRMLVRSSRRAVRRLRVTMVKRRSGLVREQRIFTKTGEGPSLLSKGLQSGIA